MKLRLPHKFHAALIAALASVSFTTLSSGTIAVATGAALLAGQQAQANLQEQITTNSVTVAGTTYTSTAADGVHVVKGDSSDGTPLDLGSGVTAEYTFLTSTNSSGGTNQGRYKVDGNAATRMANYGTIILANGTAGGVTYNGGQIYVQSNVTVANDLILGTSNYAENNWNGAIRMSGGDTFTGDVLFAQNAKLTVSGSNTFTGTVSGADKKLELGQGGTLTFAGNLTLKSLNAASASVVFSGSHVVISGSGQDEGIHQTGGTVTVGGGAGTTLMELGRLELGDAQGGSSALNVLNGATLKITGSNNNENYKQASFILGEWSIQTTATIGGTVLSKDADVRAGDTGGTINIASTGTLAAKGIRTSKSADANRFTVNVNGGRLILGSTGILAQSLNLNSGATLGLYADSANITGPTALNGHVTFDTQKYAFAADGNSVAHAASGTAAINVTGATTIASGAHLSEVGGGSVALSASSIDIGAGIATEGNLSIGTSSTTLSVGGTIANSGNLSLAGAVTLAANGSYEIFGDIAEGDFDGTGAYAGSGHRRGNNTQYYLVHGSDSSSLNSTVTVSGGSIVDGAGIAGKDVVVQLGAASESDMTYYVNTAVDYSSSVMGDATGIIVTPNGLLRIGGSDANGLLNTKITGSGTVVINENTSLPTGTASNPYTTLATGTLRIAASKTLTLGTDKGNHYYDLSSFSKVELENGATINLKQRPGVVLNNVSVASGATAHIGKNDDNNDTYNKDIDAATLRGTTLVNGELQMGTNWKWQMSIDKLAGSGTVVARGANETHRLIINAIDDFTGTLKYTGGSTEIVLNGSGTITNLDNTGSGNTLTLQGGADDTVHVASNDKLANTITMNGGGILRLTTTQGGQNVTLTTITADNLKLGGDSDHSSRFLFNSANSLAGVKHLYLDGGQLWLNNASLNYAGAVTFSVTSAYNKDGANTNLNGASIRVNNDGTFSGAVDVQADTKITWAANKTIEFSGEMTGSGNWELASYNSNSGTFKVSGDASGYEGFMTSASNITLNVASGAQLTLAGGSSLTGNVTLDGALKMNSAANTTSTISGTVSGAGLLTADGAGTLTLTHANTYSGGTTVNGGTVNVNAQNALGTGDVTVNGGTLNLGGSSHTLSTLTVNGGTVTTTNNSGNGCITGDIYINAGGTFQVNGGHDAFGYNGGQTDNIVMQGSADHYATLQLNQNNTTNSVTMQTNLVMKGYAAITSKANTKGFNTHSGSITATGTHNTIDLVDIRRDVTIDVTNTGDELTIGKMTKNSDGTKVLTKTGAGTLNFTGPAEANALNVNAGAVNFADTAAISGAVALGENAALSTAGATIGGAVSLATGSSWTNTGATTVAGATTLSGTAALTNSGTLTLNGNFAMAAGSSVTNSGTVNFGAHTLTIAQDCFEITSTGSVAFNAGTMFDLSLLTEGENHTFTLFTGAGAGVDLSGYNFTVANITGFEDASQYGWTFNANGTITYSETMSFEWAGTASEWVDGGDGWTKNGNPAQYASSVDADAVFVASEESGFVKDISVNTAVQAHNVTVQDVYSFNLANGGSVTATALALEGNAASLSIDGTGTVSATAITAAGKDITVGSGIVLQGGTADAFNLHGSGTYALGSGTTALGSVVLDAAWTGTLKFSHVASYANINLNAEAFNNTSAIEFDDVTGNWCSGNNHYTRQLILSGQGLTVTNGYSTANYYFDGGVSGAGDMKFTRTDAVTQNLNFTKDISGWTGSLQVLNGFTVNANFYGEAATVNAGISRTGGTLNVLVGNGSTASTTTFTKAVGASSLTVKSLATATFNEAVTLAGDLNLNANATATFNKAVSAASLEAGASKSTGADVTFNGDLTLSGSLTLDGTDAKAATVALNGDTTVNGSFDLSHGQKAHGSVTLASNKTLDLKGSIWMSQTASLILQQDATAKFGGDLTVKGLANGATVARTGSADQYSLGNSSYTLAKVEATVNTAQDNVQLLFTDSKFVTGQNVTLKNAGSSFTAMDIQGGTTTVQGASALAEATTMQLGAVTLSGGNLTLNDAHLIGAATSLNVTATGTVSGGTLAMGGLITMGADATLTLTGTTVDITKLPVSGEETHSHVGGTTEDNGFASLDAMVQLVDFTRGGTVVTGTGTTYVRDGVAGTLMLDSTDTETYGYVRFNSPTYSAFYVNTAGSTESLNNAITLAGEHGGLTDVYLNGGTLNADVDTQVNALHIHETEGVTPADVYLTGTTANFGTVSGSGTLNVGADTTLNADTLVISSGKTLTIAGSQNVNATTIANNGTLDIANGAKVTTTATALGGSGTSFTTTGEGTFAGTGFTLEGGTVSLGSDALLTGNVTAKSGTLTIGGDTDIEGTLFLGDNTHTAVITVEKNASLTANAITGAWGFNSFTVNGTLNVEGNFTLSTGNDRVYAMTGSGIINTGTLTIGNVGNYKFDGAKGLRLKLGAGGIQNGDSRATLTLANGLTVQATAASSSNKNIILDGPVTLDTNGYDLTMSGNITGEGTLTKTGNGTLTLTGTGNVLYNAIDLQGGSLVLNGAFDATNISHTQGGLEYYADPEGEVTANGFAKYTANVALVTTNPGSVTEGQNASFTLDGYAAEYDTATGQLCGKLDTSVFYVNDPNSTVNLEAILKVNPDARVDAKADSITIVADDTEHVFSTDSITIDTGVTATTLQINENVTVAAGTAAKTLTLTGEGTYKLHNNGLNLESGVQLDTGWTGVVQVAGFSGKIDLGDANSANNNSYIGLTNVSGWFGPTTTIAKNLLMTDGEVGTPALNITGNSTREYDFTGNIKGEGSWNVRLASAGERYNLKGDVSGWTGSMNVDTTGQELALRIDGDASVVKADISGNVAVQAKVDTELHGALNVNSLTVDANKTATLKGVKERSLGDVAVSGTLNIMDVTNAVSLSVGDVTIGANATVGVYSGETAAENAEGTLSINGHRLTAEGSGSTLNANLVMGGSSILDVSAMSGNGGLHMGSSVTLKPGEVSLSTSDMEMVMALDPNGRYDLFNGVDSFILGSNPYEQIGMSDTWVKAADVFSNTEFTGGKDYYVFYSGANPGGNGSNVGAIYVMQIPEPTTGTLSLLALAALAARRRKK